jgi:hypothetical protein
MRLVTFLAAAGLAYAAYALLTNPPRVEGPRPRLPRPDDGRGAGDGNAVRPAGRDQKLRPLCDEWDEVDEASDESFPASDPPARW